MIVLNIIKYVMHSIKFFIYYFIGNFKALYYGVKLGVGAKVSPNAMLNKTYFIGKALIARDVSIGEGTYINSGEIHSGEIGAWCSLGYNVIIGPSEHDPDKLTTSPTLAKKLNFSDSYTMKDLPAPIIEDEVWIGAGAIILRGVRIEKGAIVAAGSVVTKNIPSYEIWGGVPAKFIRKRNH